MILTLSYVRTKEGSRKGYSECEWYLLVCLPSLIRLEEETSHVGKGTRFGKPVMASLGSTIGNQMVYMV